MDKQPMSFPEFYAIMTDGFKTHEEISAAFTLKLQGSSLAFITMISGNDIIVAEYDFASSTASHYM